MRKHWKRFLLMFGLSWVAAAVTVTLLLGRYAAEDFSLPDMTPIYLILAVSGLPLTAIVALPAPLFLRRQLRSMRCAILYPLVSALLVVSLPAATSVVGVFIFESLRARLEQISQPRFIHHGVTLRRIERVTE